MAISIISMIPSNKETGRRPVRVRVQRAVLLAGALVYAGLAIGSGSDRLAFVRPDMAGSVPTMFATDARKIIVAGELSDNPAAAVTAAAQLVARAPVEPVSTALLGTARAAMGDDDGAQRAFRIAGQLGWRIPLTQSYWLYAALASGDMTVAAQRLDALLRQKPELLRRPETLAPFESDLAGRQALLDRLATRPPWLGWFSGQNDQVPAAQMAGRVPMLIALASRGVVLGCDAVAPALAGLQGAGFQRELQGLRRAHCPAMPN